VLGILEAAKMRIESNGLTDLMSCMKEGMKEANKANLKINIQVLGCIAEALGPKVKTYLKKCFEPMVVNISDKQTLVRECVVECCNKWCEVLESSSEVLTIICKLVE